MIDCPICSSGLHVKQLSCGGCGVDFNGRFSLPRLARLSHLQQGFVEALVLAGGNLKTLAEELDVSYPTLRKRLDVLIADMNTLKVADEKEIDSILKSIETGDISAEQGLRHMKEINGAL
tara:strand:- start:214191 stop:214550 length:360 start_codon:yes stop_codon:yes gene_type:complete